MIIVEITVKNKKRRHVKAWFENEDDYLWDDYIVNDELENTISKWIDKYKQAIVTNDIEIIKILREHGYRFYDID